MTRTEKLAGLLVTATWLVLLTAAEGGHELPVYPSYYPSEIRLDTVEPTAAARLLEKAAIHAYVGDVPIFKVATSEHIGHVASLGSYLTLTLNRASPLATDRESACAVARTVVQALASQREAFVFHPYPVTPFHGDYLHHADLAEAAKKRYSGGDAGGRLTTRALRVKARGPLAERLVRALWPAGEAQWDVALEQADVSELVASHGISVNGWLGPPWAKEGWYHAYLLLADDVADPAAKESVASIVRRLQRGDYRKEEEKLNLERMLVSSLISGCERVIVGYTEKREYFNTEFSAGIENIAYDSHTGFNSPIFLRTVKLKDLPWNGWLRLGSGTPPAAAWNPVGGFTDPAGRIIWFAVSDQALFPEPYGASWTLNRVEDFKLGSGK